MTAPQPDWRPIASAPLKRWLITARQGEKGSNLSLTPDGEEWVFMDGSTTITHHTRLPPTHWMPLPPPPGWPPQ